MSDSDPMTCIHQSEGLCESCQAQYDADPEAWIEFGDHPAGIRRWHEEQERMRREHDESEIPW